MFPMSSWTFHGPTTTPSTIPAQNIPSPWTSQAMRKVPAILNFYYASHLDRKEYHGVRQRTVLLERLSSCILLSISVFPLSTACRGCIATSVIFLATSIKRRHLVDLDVSTLPQCVQFSTCQIWVLLHNFPFHTR